MHWYFDEKILKDDYALKIIKWLKKPAVVEWLGSDIRNPLIEFKDNPYFREAYPLFYDLAPEQVADNTIQMQKRFATAGFETVLCADMQKYIAANTFKQSHFIRQRINLNNFPLSLPSSSENKPVLVHAPSKTDIKGTHFVLKAIEALKAQNLSFEFVLIQNQTHENALKAIQNCDIFIDQFIVGSYGMAAIEAMAYGKPVITYVKQANWVDYPENCPIVNTKGEDLTDALKDLIQNADRRQILGQSSRAYIEQYHDTKVVVPDLIEIYKKVIAK